MRSKVLLISLFMKQVSYTFSHFIIENISYIFEYRALHVLKLSNTDKAAHLLFSKTLIFPKFIFPNFASLN